MAAPADSVKVVDRVNYQRHSGEPNAPDLEDTEESQLEFNSFVAVALGRLAEFKSTVVFK